MNRRQFLLTTASAVAASALAPFPTSTALAQLPTAALPAGPREDLTAYFLQIVDGFLKNARATSPDYTVCDFPKGTVLKACTTPSGKTYVSVARMLPALAEYVHALDGAPAAVSSAGQQVELQNVLLSIFRTAFDPKHPHYWGEPPPDKATQRTVESSLVAIALARLGPDFIAKLTPQERANINQWLASCTKVPERTNNHAWFTAVNQAARLKLARSFPEFKGDEAWMIDDLKAMDVLAANASDGWYSDDPKLTVYDYYNFWTFGNFPLFFSRIAGDLYPDWNAKLRARAREFLQNTPYFFAADGSVPLFGRSLLYRWAVLSPLLLGYEQGLWPHSPGLLRTIVTRNMKWWWDLGAYDAGLGKLRETLSPAGTPDVTENYVDNGHPYWAMQGFTFFSIPRDDPFWTAPEEPLPVEKADYLVKIPGPKMLVAGTKSSGQVRWLQAQNTPRREYYRDKYNKLVWSSAFPFNVLQPGREVLPHGPWDQTLTFRNAADPAQAAWRIFPESGQLLDDGVRTTWTTKLGDVSFRVVSTVRLIGEFHLVSHTISTESGDPADAIQAVEGSHALGLRADEDPEITKGDDWLAARSKTTGHLLASWRLTGHESLTVTSAFGPKDEQRVNLVHPKSAVITLTAPRVGKTLHLATLHYASPKPLPMDQIHSQAQQIIADWKRTVRT